MCQMHLPHGLQAVTQLADTALTNCLFAMCSSIHGALRASPGAMAFQCDMILDIPTIADWEIIQQNRQQLLMLD